MRAEKLRLAALASGAATALYAAPAAQASVAADPRSAAIHPVSDQRAMAEWLSRVPVTRDFPDDFAPTLAGHGPAFVIEMTTSPGCVPCGDLWSKLSGLARRYGWQVRTLGPEQAAVLSGRMGLPWVGYPVAWVRPRSDQARAIPIAIGTDHTANLARNLYLSSKMLTGVRPAVAVRAMAKFTGIVASPAPDRKPRP
ncbi:hypothetical protein [Novosphingobium sp.]|uniref:hypothetical protein n=1 Tax=Novosphingobium sp. TaxID=1874826 RepID=UPI003FA5DBF9